MLIELESVYGDKILFGKHMSEKDLQTAMAKLLKIVDEQEFSATKRTPTGFEKICGGFATYENIGFRLLLLRFLRKELRFLLFCAYY